MARLNDPAPSLDSVEALKRRFIRQNREIARVNSTQSQRIRNLETEISRLLGENIELREQAINASQKAQKARLTCSRCQQLKGLKGFIEGKLADIYSLVDGLAVLDKDRHSISPGPRRSSIFRFPGQENITYGGAVKPAKQPMEGFLPAITEDKSYPRKTLDVDELKDIRLEEVASESPDLGPPPIAHFDVTNIHQFEPQPSRTQHSEDVTASASATNVDKRRRRRASALLDANSSECPDSGESLVALRSTAGSKRKLSVRESGFNPGADADNRSEEFPFQRTKAGTRTPSIQSQARTEQSGVVQRRLEESPRKALQPKDPNSPTKPKRTAALGKAASLDDNIARLRDPRQQRRDKWIDNRTTPLLSNADQQAPLSEKLADSINAAPFTPAGADIFSPTSTEPSAARSNPPAPEIKPISSVEDVINQSSRPSRRPKSAISYAEPSLRDKMRRPTKELVPAIVDNSRPQQRSRSAKLGTESETLDSGDVASEVELEKPKMRTVVIKKETTLSESNWKSLPPLSDSAVSPLLGKAHRNMRLNPEQMDTRNEDETTKVGPPESTLAATTRLSTEKRNEDLEQALDKLSIFDGPNSSPSSPTKPESKSEEHTDVPKRSIKSSRRHSTNPVGTRDQNANFDLTGANKHVSNQSSATMKRREREGSTLEAHRPSSALANGEKKESSTQGVRLGRSESVKKLAEKRTTDPRSGSGELARKGERTMSRRRSMMI